MLGIDDLLGPQGAAGMGSNLLIVFFSAVGPSLAVKAGVVQNRRRRGDRRRQDGRHGRRAAENRRLARQRGRGELGGDRKFRQLLIIPGNYNAFRSSVC